MKTKLIALNLSLAALAIGALSGCAHVRENSTTQHSIVDRAVVTPPGWTVTHIVVTNSGAGNSLGTIAVTAPGTNQYGFWASLTAPRPHVYTDFAETWRDTSSGGGTFVFTDPQASQATFTHSNQAALGGSRSTVIGSISSTITSNAVSAITASGGAVGNVIGAAAKAASGTP